MCEGDVGDRWVTLFHSHNISDFFYDVDGEIGGNKSKVMRILGVLNLYELPLKRRSLSNNLIMVRGFLNIK
jgi:hypothetical protein